MLVIRKTNNYTNHQSISSLIQFCRRVTVDKIYCSMQSPVWKRSAAKWSYIHLIYTNVEASISPATFQNSGVSHALILKFPSLRQPRLSLDTMVLTDQLRRQSFMFFSWPRHVDKDKAAFPFGDNRGIFDGWQALTTVGVSILRISQVRLFRFPRLHHSQCSYDIAHVAIHIIIQCMTKMVVEAKTNTVKTVQTVTVNMWGDEEFWRVTEGSAK